MLVFIILTNIIRIVYFHIRIIVAMTELFTSEKTHLLNYSNIPVYNTADTNYFDNRIATEKEMYIINIKKDMAEINTIFSQINKIINDHQIKIDTFEDHIKDAQYYIDIGNTNVTNFREKNDKCCGISKTNCFCLILLFLLIFVILAVLFVVLLAK